MSKSYKFFSGLVCVALLGGCATGTPKEPIRKVAIVSLSVNGVPLEHSIRTKQVQTLVDGVLSKMVDVSEEKFSRIMQISHVASFVNNPAYRKEGVKNENSFIPAKVGGNSMVLFADDKDGVRGGEIKPESARKLCADLHVDGVMLIYSDWDYQRGAFVPTVKAYTANIITLWDRDGSMVYKRRINEIGSDNLGVGFARFVNDKTITEWKYAFEVSLNEFVADMKKLTL